MTDAEETAYTRGHRMALTQILSLVLEQLGYDATEANAGKSGPCAIGEKTTNAAPWQMTRETRGNGPRKLPLDIEEYYEYSSSSEDEAADGEPIVSHREGDFGDAGQAGGSGRPKTCGRSAPNFREGTAARNREVRLR